MATTHVSMVTATRVTIVTMTSHKYLHRAVISMAASRLCNNTFCFIILRVCHLMCWNFGYFKPCWLCCVSSAIEKHSAFGTISLDCIPTSGVMLSLSYKHTWAHPHTLSIWLIRLWECYTGRSHKATGIIQWIIVHFSRNSGMTVLWESRSVEKKQQNS